MDEKDFIDVLCLEILGDFPDANLKRMINMFLVTSSDHGLTPSALSTRLTLHGAPESLQGAVAAGLLGAGSRFLGTVEYSARFLAELAADVGTDWSTEGMRAAAQAAVARSRASGKRIPGIGHPIHVHGDPRCIKLLKVANECGYQGRHCALAQEIAAAATRAAGKPVPRNATGAKGAILLDMGMSPEFGKGLTLVGRVAGLIAHVIEERERPIAQQIWDIASAHGLR
ncbi:2-methylcitrate synthase/citrate synthase II [compost metagenome]